MIRSKDIHLTLFDSNFKYLGMIADFESLMWTERYYDLGTFDIVVRYTDDNISVLKVNNFIMRSDKTSVFRIMQVEYSRDVAGNKTIHATGCDALNVLNQRIIHSTINFRGTPVNYIYTILNNNVISPSSTYRPLSLFQIVEGLTSSSSLRAQTSYEPVLDKILEICKQYGLGIRLVYQSGDDAPLGIELYEGTNRSTYQSDNTKVLFDDEIGNINAWSFTMDYTNYKNYALVGGEGEGNSRKKTTAGGGMKELFRYEMFVDASDLSTDTDDGTLDEDEYLELLQQRGYEALAEQAITYTFAAETNESIYEYGTDYSLGDIVTIRTAAVAADARITEVAESFDSTGYAIFPNFEVTDLRFVLATESNADLITEEYDEIIT